LITVSSLAGRPLTLTESHDSAEEYSLSQLSFNHKKSLRVAMAQRLSCHAAGAKLPLSGLDAEANGAARFGSGISINDS
jgi:hypothetical protein